MLLTWTLATFGVTLDASWLDESRELVTLLQAGAFVVALAVGGIALSRWYLTSDAPALWIGAAVMLYGIARLGFSELLPHVVVDGVVTDLAVWVRPAAQVVAVGMLCRALMITPVSSQTSAPKLTVAGAGAVVVFATLFSLAPALAAVVDGAASTGTRAYTSVNQLGVMPFAWTAVALGFTWQSVRRRRWLFTWLGLLLACLALGDITRVLAPPPIETGLLGKEIMRALGLVLGLHGATREILHTYRDHSTRLAQSEYTAMTAEERIREGRADAEERAHEARSALAAIEGATRTLEHYRDRLPAETQSALSSAISGEIHRLQRLVSVEEGPAEIMPFSLAESLAPIVATERARGVPIDVQVPGDVNVIGRATATEQVIQTLFDNARRYAPDTRMRVRTEQQDGWVVLRIEDRGPGVAADQREAIFRRGVRGESALDIPGSGLGLYVAAKLMREQGAELWVDERPGGGSSFAMALPAATDSAVVKNAVEGLDEPREAAQSGVLRSLRSGD